MEHAETETEMSRAARKRYERIYTRRAQQGFPRVSRAILHRNGSVAAVLPRCGPGRPRYYDEPKPVVLLLPERPPSVWNRLLNSLRRLMRRILG
jgi:hypothetical protein